MAHIRPLVLSGMCKLCLFTASGSKPLSSVTAEGAALDVFDNNGDTLLQLNGTALPSAASPAAATPSRNLLAALPTFLDWRQPASESMRVMVKLLPPQ